MGGPVYLFILAGLLFAKIKKYKISYIFINIDFYPLFVIEAVHVFFQVLVFCGNYDYVKYAPYIHKASMLSLLLPIILRKLHIQALVGSGFVFFGTLLNKVCIKANGGYMPVYPTLSKLTGYFREGDLSKGYDNLHIAFSGTTKLDFLSDYIDTGVFIMSIGDLFIYSFIVIVVYYAVKGMNFETIREDANHACS